MSEGNPPSQDPADDTSLAGTLRATFKKMLQGVDNMLPARVLSYDRDSNVATVQPIIAMLTTDGSRVPRAQIAKVPVLALGGGGFCINFPLVKGDLGWIEASDRDISLYLQNYNEAQPNTTRLHSFEDGRFIPDVMSKFDLGGDDSVPADAMTIQSLDGNVRIEISPNTIRVKAPTVRIDADNVNVAGEAIFEDAVQFLSETTFEAESTFNDDAVVNGIRFSTHKHTGVTTGGGTSGGPTP